MSTIILSIVCAIFVLIYLIHLGVAAYEHVMYRK